MILRIFQFPDLTYLGYLLKTPGLFLPPSPLVKMNVLSSTYQYRTEDKDLSDLSFFLSEVPDKEEGLPQGRPPLLRCCLQSSPLTLLHRPSEQEITLKV
jgi:hypothetical protein